MIEYNNFPIVGLQLPDCTAVAIIGPPSSVSIGSIVTLTATITPNMEGYTVTFMDGAVQLGQTTTNSSGDATLNWDTTNEIPGDHSIIVIASPGLCTSTPITINLFNTSSQPTFTTSIMTGLTFLAGLIVGMILSKREENRYYLKNDYLEEEKISK